MQKKELKRRTQIKSRKRKNKNNNLKLLLLIVAIIVLIVSILSIGKTITILLAILFGIITGIWFIL